MDSKIVASKNQLSCGVAGETVLLHLQSGVYYALNSVGTSIWNLIQEPKTLQEVRDSIIEQYQVDADRCERDVLDLVRKLESAGLIELRDELGA